MIEVVLHDGRVKTFKDRESAVKYAEASQGTIRETNIIKGITWAKIKKALRVNKWYN